MDVVALAADERWAFEIAEAILSIKFRARRSHAVWRWKLCTLVTVTPDLRKFGMLQIRLGRCGEGKGVVTSTNTSSNFQASEDIKL